MAQGKQGSQKPQGDATGRAKERAEAEASEERAEAEKRMGMITAQQRITDSTATFDPTTGAVIAESDDDLQDTVIVGEDEVIQHPTTTSDQITDEGVVTVEDDYVQIRVNGNYENVTIGYGNTYNFEAGKKYRVPRNVAAHLEEKGCVWH